MLLVKLVLLFWNSMAADCSHVCSSLVLSIQGLTSTKELDAVVSGNVDILHCHPEALFVAPEGRRLLDSNYKNLLKAVIVDECHKIGDW